MILVQAALTLCSLGVMAVGRENVICYAKILRQEEAARVCPLCRKPLPHKCLKKYPPNYALLELLFSSGPVSNVCPYCNNVRLDGIQGEASCSEVHVQVGSAEVRSESQAQLGCRCPLELLIPMSNENLNLEANSGDRQRVLYLSEFSQLNHLRKLHLTSIGVASNISSGASDDSNCSTDSEEEQRANDEANGMEEGAAGNVEQQQQQQQEQEQEEEQAGGCCSCMASTSGRILVIAVSTLVLLGIVFLLA